MTIVTSLVVIVILLLDKQLQFLSAGISGTKFQALNRNITVLPLWPVHPFFINRLD
jgi:hypothetical protein